MQAAAESGVHQSQAMAGMRVEAAGKAGAKVSIRVARFNILLSLQLSRRFVNPLFNKPVPSSCSIG